MHFQVSIMTKKKIVITYILFLLYGLTFAQNTSEEVKQKYTISGTIRNSINNETLIGANIYIPETKSSANTNEYGFYSITLPKGSYTLIVTYVGFSTFSNEMELSENLKFDVTLNENNESLKEVIVSDGRYRNDIRSAEMSINKLPISSIKKMPVILGETDVLKSLLLIPGVTNAGEGASGFNVRGGGADQNLILLDEATIFNSSHVFGFFSVFNADAIKDLKLYKGGIPSQFGGRAASVLEVYQKEGNSKEFHMNGGIGLITSRLLAEGPLFKNKGSFLFGGRSSYAHLFLKLSEDRKNSAAYFYDTNMKLSYNFNQNNTIYLSGYFGRDVFSLNKTFTNIYGNSTLNLRWNHLYSDKLFSNLSLIYSDYYYGLNLDFVGFQWDSGIKNYNIKYDFKNYLSDNIKLKYGTNIIYYDFNPGTIKPSDTNSGINFDQLDKKYALEPSLYLSAEQEINYKLNLTYGLRYSLFYRLGASTINIYANNNPVIFNSDLQIYEKANPVGTEFYSNNKIIQSYDNLEPRFSVAYQLNENNSLKGSYNRMVQYLQLVSNTSSPTPLDVWTPADNFIKPQIGDQIALGYFKNFSENKYALEIETYYKKVKNRIDYIDGADLIANKALEQVILNGQLRSYGLELMLRKTEGRLNGWISYTISKSEQQTPGRTASEPGINYGNWYKSAYDKLHNLAFTGNYNFNSKWSFSTNFMLQSGQPVTYPNGKYSYLGVMVPSYDLRNKNRLPAYHHLDIAATLTPKKNADRNCKREWVFSIYNLYNRKNAASINFRQNDDTGISEAVKTSIFGIVPAVSYNFKF